VVVTAAVRCSRLTRARAQAEAPAAAAGGSPEAAQAHRSRPGRKRGAGVALMDGDTLEDIATLRGKFPSAPN
jgi:hypothetical protein